MNYALGIDLGTSYFKFGLYDENLNLKGLGRVAVEKNIGCGNLCEVSPETFTRLIQEGINQACQQANITSKDISAIGYSSQANSFILLDKNNKPLTQLILWPDIRAKILYPEIIKLWNENDFLQTTGIGIEPSLGLCINKLLWYKKNKPEIWNQTANVLTISDYLVYLFTGQKAGDMGTASLLGLMDCQTGKWWNKAFDILQIDQKLFTPRLTIGTKINTCKASEELFSIKSGTSFYIGSLDHHIAALGAGLNKNADMSESTGTVLACVNFTDKYMPRKNVSISPWKSNHYCQLTFDSNGAVSLEWYQQNFAKEHSLTELIKMAEEVGSSQGLKAKKMAFNYKSVEDAFEGIKKIHTHGHFVYALMESTANTLNNLVQKLSPDKKPKKIVATGGGAKSDLWLEIKSKITGHEFIRTDYPEPATLGAGKLCNQ
ncbi:MAG: FGGY-family carbohydrate kinase [Phycisphaerales bacterium]